MVVLLEFYMEKLNKILAISRQFKNNPIYDVQLKIDFKSNHKSPIFNYNNRKYYDDGNNFYLAKDDNYLSSNIWHQNYYQNPENYTPFSNPYNTINSPIF